jgi:pSer/pThr/pTyr-binding forkhead associated (FHA) protein
MINNKTVESPFERLGLGMIPKLVAIGGPLTGRTFYVDEPVISIGRLESNDIRLEDPFVSRHHCLIRNEGGQYMIEDLHSANGTYVDRERVKASSLKEGSIIQIGASRFLFRLPEDVRSEISDPRFPQDLKSEISDLKSMAFSQNLIAAESGRSSLVEIRLG